MLGRLRQFHFDWKLTVLTAVLLPLLVSLGFWQLDREAEKLQLQSQYASRQQDAPVELALLDVGEDLQYRQVEVSGIYDSAHVFLLDNKIYQGQPGYEVVLPMTTAAGLTVFINRGWMPQGSYRDQLPTVSVADGSNQVQGTVYVPVGAQFVLGPELAAEGWPKVVQTLDIPALAALAGYGVADEVFPHTVRLAEGTDGVPAGYWPIISTTPEKHRGYAVQWFAMATVLAGLYIFYSTRAAQADPDADDATGANRP